MLGVLVTLLLYPPLPPADVFSPEFETRVAALRKSTAKPIVHVNEAWVEFIRRLPAESPGKQAYVGFLKDRYGYTIGRVNEAYAIDFSSFTDLTSFDFQSLNRSRPAVVADDREFLATIREVLDRLLAMKP